MHSEPKSDEEKKNYRKKTKQNEEWLETKREEHLPQFVTISMIFYVTI